MKFLRFMLAFLFGALGGFLIYMELAMTFFHNPPGWFIFVSLFGGWGLVTYWLMKGTRGVAELLGRAFLLSAILSFSLTPAVFIVAVKGFDTSSDGAIAGSIIGGGLVGGMGIVVSLTLTFLSLLGYALVKLFTRETRTGTAGDTACPVCSETIKVTARKCRHCGELLGEEGRRQ